MYSLAIIILSLLSFTIAIWLGNVNPQKIRVFVFNGFGEVRRVLGIIVSVAGSSKIAQTHSTNDEQALILTK